MKENLHPDYHDITVVMTDGTEFVTRSTYGKTGAKLHLDVDPKTHPAWTGTHRLIDRGGQLDKFKKRFAGLVDGESKQEVKAAAPAEKIKLTTTASSAATEGKKKKKS